MMYGAIKVSQDSYSQSNVLHEPASAVKAHNIVHTVLIFKNNKQPRDHIAYQILSAKPKRNPRNTGRRDKRADIHPHLRKCHHHRHDKNKNADSTSRNPDKRIFAFLFRISGNKTIWFYRAADEPFKKKIDSAQRDKCDKKMAVIFT